VLVAFVRIRGKKIMVVIRVMIRIQGSSWDPDHAWC